MMKIKLLKSKIHRATITDANLDYIGSISIDENLIKAANLYEFEKVHVLSLTTGERIETYVIKAPAGSQEICINGAAAHKIQKNEMVIIVAYGSINEYDAKNHQPTIVHVNENNIITD